MGKEEVKKRPKEKKSDGVQSDSTSQLLSSQGSRLDKLEDTFEKRLATNTTNLITVFGIFASIVTFLSIEIQIFKNICDPLRLLGFSLIVLASLVSFIFVLHVIANFWINEKAKEYPKIIIAFILLFFIGGIALFFTGKDEASCKENFIFQRYSNDFNSKQIDLETNINSKLNNFEQQFNDQIKSVEKQVESLKQK